MSAAVKQRMSELERTAFHEAGHAVVSCVLRIPIKSITIDSCRTTLSPAAVGQVLHGGVHENPFHFYVLRLPRSVAKAKKHLAVKRAGIHAEMRALRSVYFGGSEEMVIGQMETTLEECEPGIVRRMDIESRKILSSHWPAVKAVARALLVRNTMSGRAVRSLMRWEEEVQ
jgi:ATP-dependent Zn protease